LSWGSQNWEEDTRLDRKCIHGLLAPLHHHKTQLYTRAAVKHFDQDLRLEQEYGATALSQMLQVLVQK
jgi:hypothetical protein